MRKSIYTFTASLWIYPGETASWHFITVPKQESRGVRANFSSLKRGWGSLPVIAKIGKTTWNTSIFPDSKSGTYILPIKALVRNKEGLQDGDVVTLKLKINL